MPRFEPGAAGRVTCNDGSGFILSAAVSEERVHDVRLVTQNRHHVGDRLNPDEPIEGYKVSLLFSSTSQVHKLHTYFSMFAS